MSKSKAKGTWWETAIVNWLKERYTATARRKVLAGSADEGDITWGDGTVVIEAKNVRTASYPAWVREAEAEAKNSGAGFGVCFAKVVGKGTVDGGLVLMTPATFMRLAERARLIDKEMQA